jgi:hypothetical protein
MPDGRAEYIIANFFRQNTSPGWVQQSTLASIDSHVPGDPFPPPAPVPLSPPLADPDFPSLPRPRHSPTALRFSPLPIEPPRLTPKNDIELRIATHCFEFDRTERTCYNQPAKKHFGPVAVRKRHPDLCFQKKPPHRSLRNKHPPWVPARSVDLLGFALAGPPGQLFHRPEHRRPVCPLAGPVVELSHSSSHLCS